jgi:hypothetical protein
MLARASASIFLAAAILAAAQEPGEAYGEYMTTMKAML